MTDTQVETAFPDLRAVRLDDLMPAALEKVVQRVLPGQPVTTVRLGSSFSSSI